MSDSSVMKWYAVRAIGGQENKVKTYIENEIARLKETSMFFYSHSNSTWCEYWRHWLSTKIGVIKVKGCHFTPALENICEQVHTHKYTTT